jgi:hypothetical protein
MGNAKLLFVGVELGNARGEVVDGDIVLIQEVVGPRRRRKSTSSC